MKIDFPKEEKNLSPQDAFFLYNLLTERHLYFLKKQSICINFYWHGAGVFFLVNVILFGFQNKGFTLPAFIWAIITGIGCLLAFAWMMQMDFESTIKAADCLKEAVAIEETYNYPGRFQSIFEGNKILSYRGHLLNRGFPIGFVCLGTAAAGTLLAFQAGAWAAVVAALVSAVALFVGSRFYIKATRKILLGD